MGPSGETRRWFYVRDGRRLGPVETARLVDLVLSGEVQEEDLVWHSGLPEWLKAREVEEIRRELPPPVPVAPPPPLETVTSEDVAAGPDGVSLDEYGPSPEDAPGAGPETPGEASGHRRRRKRKHRHHHDARRRPAWLWPLAAVLIALMIFLWWLLRRMNEVPPGRIIQTGSLGAPPSPYRAALGRDPSVSSSVTSWPARLTTTVTLSPGFLSPSA
ncbi:MAG TPA: DUF4339 domain-containing protein [Vicinamibacteria bacterium]|nr:DUF4339 domain-containing protein [Vicinamibacteria bacterium]